MKRLAIITALFAAPVGAAPLATWSGAGPNACNGGCTFEETAAQISPEFQEQWRVAQQDQPEPVELFVQDGAVFLASTYLVDGQQKVTKTHTVATLDQPEPAMGWVLADGSMFVKLDDCTNPTLVTDQVIDTTGVPKPYAVRAASLPAVPTRSIPGASFGVSSIPTLTNSIPSVTDDTFEIDAPDVFSDGDPVIVVTEPVIASVPLPMPGFLLLSSFAALLTFRRK